MIDLNTLQETLTELAETKPRATITEVIDWLADDPYWLKDNIGGNLYILKELLFKIENT